MAQAPLEMVHRWMMEPTASLSTWIDRIDRVHTTTVRKTKKTNALDADGNNELISFKPNTDALCIRLWIS